MLYIIFDNDEQQITYASGNNPKFSFDTTIEKEIPYNQLEDSYLEIFIYSLPLNTQIETLKTQNSKDVINSATLYSALKIDLLTLAIAPEHHDIGLVDNKKKHIQIGRINYMVSCSHIENIHIQLDNINFTLNSMTKNDLALKLKMKAAKTQKQSKYTKEFHGKLIPKEEHTEYSCSCSGGDSNNNDNDSNSNVLSIQNKMSMKDLRNSESVLNIYTVRLVDDNTKVTQLPKSKINTSNNNTLNFNRLSKRTCTTKMQFNFNKNFARLDNLKLTKSYILTAYAKLNFYKILSENDDLITKQTSKFFLTMTNKNITATDPHKHPNLTNTHNNNTNNNNTPLYNNEDEFQFKVFKCFTENYTDTLYFKGTPIGTITFTINLSNIPLIRQVMCGVMTETGFEINSIFLYKNLQLSSNNKTLSSLPADLQTLIRYNNDYESAIANRTQLQSGSNVNEKDFNNQLLVFLKGIKDVLGKSIEESCLYYGYSSDFDLYQGQAVMLELGLNMLEIIDKLNMELRNCCFEILKLLHKRSEFDLGTLSLKWFNDKKDNNNNNNTSSNIILYEFKDDILIHNQIIENFIRFNIESLRLCLESISRGKNIDNETRSFTYYYLSVSYFRLPKFREAFISSILKDINNDNNNIYDCELLSYAKKKRKNTIDDFIEQNPINNLILWENLFYKKLSSSLTSCSLENDIQEQLNEMNIIINYKPAYMINSHSTWQDRLSRRDYVFYGFVSHLTKYVLNSNTSLMETDINWLNIPGYDSIFYAINYQLTTMDVNEYSQQLMKLIALYIGNHSLINSFISLIIQRTNAYDTKAVFTLITLIHIIFKEYENKQHIVYTNKLDYYLLQSSFRITITIDNSLNIAKFIWLYYKNAHVISKVHLIEITNNIFLVEFFNLFFHWSWQVRNAFYYIVLYIFGHRFKGKIPVVDYERSTNTLFTKVNSGKEERVETETYGDVFENKMKVIRGLQSIIYTEELEPTFNNYIDENRFANAISKIPVQHRINIVISIHHYETVYKEFCIWKTNNKNNSGVFVDYPNLEITPPREDIVDYNSD